jgi:hypothetical protein
MLEASLRQFFRQQQNGRPLRSRPAIQALSSADYNDNMTECHPEGPCPQSCPSVQYRRNPPWGGGELRTSPSTSTSTQDIPRPGWGWGCRRDPCVVADLPPGPGYFLQPAPEFSDDVGLRHSNTRVGNRGLLHCDDFLVRINYRATHNPTTPLIYFLTPK